MFALEEREFDGPLLARQPDRLDRWAILLVVVASVAGLGILFAS
jgi:hypothetical protein